MADKKGRLVIGDVTGGINGYDPPWAIADNQCVDAVNVDFNKSRLGRKRNGTVDPGFTGLPLSAGKFNYNLYRHVPGTDETAAELWMIDNLSTIGRLAAGTAFTVPTIKDAATGNGYDPTWASINGKLEIGYQSGTARHHLWDGSTIRRAGLAASVAPTAANTGAGAYAAVLRYYRERSTRQSGGITLGRSEPSPSVSFTPSGAGTAARVTQAAVINEGETHWEIEASIDGITFYRIATVAIGTTTYDDSAATTTYNTNPLSASTGFYTLQKPYKFIAADQNRVLGLGSYTSTDKQNRIEYSAVIGSSDISDEERVDTTTNYYNDLDEADSGGPTGLRGPVDGSFFAFKERQSWELSPTGSPSQPYRVDPLSKSIGAVAQQAIERGEDGNGNPALYWMSHRGPYMWTRIGGLRYIGHNIDHYISGPTRTITLGGGVVARTLYYPDKRQVWFWWATSGGFPDTLFIYDTMTHGWTRVIVTSAGGYDTATAAAMFANTPGASMSKDLKPYLATGGSLTAAAVLKGDTGTIDTFAGGTTGNYQAYIITKAYEPGGPGFSGEVGDAMLLAAASNGVTITATVTGDFGLQAPTGTASLTPSATETHVSKRLEGSGLSDVQFVQYQIGDAAALANSWNLGRLVAPVEKHGAMSA